MHGQTGAVVRALVGFVYPSYQSLQAVMSEDMEDDLTWLRYWVVLSVVHLVELVVDPLVDFFPGYLLAKCGFLVWCMAPVQNNGANLIFSQVGNCLFSIVLLCLNIILEFNSTDAFFRLSSHCSRNINLWLTSKFTLSKTPSRKRLRRSYSDIKNHQWNQDGGDLLFAYELFW